MRPSTTVLLFFLIVGLLDIVAYRGCMPSAEDAARQHRELRMIVKELGLTDLAVATEARYTRHPAISDPVVPFMDHPGSVEHFPTGSFWRPVH